MGKNDFDIDFDFEKEYGFDPKAFLGTEEYDNNIDLSEFSDEELGLHAPEQVTADTGFDAEDDLDAEDFLNLADMEETVEAPVEAEITAEEAAEDVEEDVYPAEEEDDFPDVMIFPKARQEETVLPEVEEPAEEEVVDPAVFEENMEQEDASDYNEQEAAYEEELNEEDEESEERPRRKFRMPQINLPKITMPKITTPKVFTKFYDLYFAPLLNKELLEEPRDPNNPRRRRKKSKIQIFKEVYLPPIIACVCLILVLSFAIGSLTNAIDAHRAAKELENKQQLAESEAADLLELERGGSFQSCIGDRQTRNRAG